MQTFKYTNIAFISYKREDEDWAKWLQKKLEHYKLPTEIRKQNPDMEQMNPYLSTDFVKDMLTESPAKEPKAVAADRIPKLPQLQALLMTKRDLHL